MTVKPWDNILINTKSGTQEAIAPVIISASRSTDIPAFYSEWLMDRLEAGYVKWVNPFNQKEQFVSFEKVRVFVFWTKNARPMLKHLKALDSKGLNYYFTFTLNDYEKEDLETNVPKLDFGVETFKRLASQLGKERVIWRFDPLILSDSITVDSLLERIEKLGQKLKGYTEKMVFSFADIQLYSKVRSNLGKRNDSFREFDPDSILQIAKGLNEINKSLGLKLATCSEKVDLSEYRIEHNKCIDDDLIIKLFNDDEKLMQFLGYEQYQQANLISDNNKNERKLKDPGQRKDCGCIVSKDIGQYNTCKHLCTYCYANHSEKLVKSNVQKANPNSDSMI